jgi:peptidoglycan/xylan/chitin deacetylase (PgdA/CDA1 family)
MEPSMMLGKATFKRLAKRLSGAISAIESAPKNSILFTFDDGPHPEVTPRILSLLERHHAKAVFFVVGARIPRAPHLLRTILEQGHALGNHSFSHPNDHTPSPRAFLADLRRCQQAIAQLTGREPRLFRPPLGRLSISGVMASRVLGLRTLLWSLDTGDWRLRDVEAARRRATELAADLSLRPAHDDILLMHDDNPCSVEVLDGLLTAVSTLGCDLSGPLDRLLAQIGR